jgi:Kef-type K+ transport system membrane component KefB
LGAALALWIYPELAPPGSSFGIFAMFIGVSMSVTAFPVLARILRERGMQRSELGTIALGSAAVDDVTAWCLLAIIVGATRASPSAAVLALGGVIAFGVFMLLVVEPFIRRRLAGRLAQSNVSHTALALSFVGVFACAWTTETIGVHALFGAFLAGAVIPHDSALARALSRQLEDVVLVLLLPPFFALTGARTDLGLLSGTGGWLTCAAIIGVACLGKLGGSSFVARLCGARWRDAWILGALMNTRGLVELIVLNVGLELGVLSKPLFAMLVVMALVTTFMTAPLLTFLDRGARAEGAST